MIIVFLIVLIIALIIANILISVARPKNNEKGFAYPPEETLEPEVVNDSYNENALMIQGAITATNKKLDLLNQRVITLETIIATLVQEKIDKDEKKKLN